MWQDFLAQATRCPATPQADVRAGDARNLTARRPFKSAARPADQRGPSTFAWLLPGQVPDAHPPAPNYERACLRQQGLSSPGAPSATLSPALNPSLGGALFATVRIRILTSHQCFFLFRETLWFVCLSLPFHPHRTKPPRRTAADAALEIAIDVSMMHLSF